MITITGEPKEIAALVAALQERQCKRNWALMLISKAVAVILITLCPFLIVNQSCIRTVLFV